MKKIAFNMISTASLVFAIGLTGITFATAGGGEDPSTTALNAAIAEEQNRQFEERQAKKRQARKVASKNDKRKR
ncbi:MAG: hypothetical protein ABJM86_06115 [Hyphomicrobiales bacterium]